MKERRKTGREPRGLQARFLRIRLNNLPGSDPEAGGKQFAKVRGSRMSYEESYAKAFPFDKMVNGMIDPEMIEDTIRLVNEAIKDKVRVNLIINNRAGGNAPMIAQMIANKLHREKQERLF